jgi:hypothetical protein
VHEFVLPFLLPCLWSARKYSNLCSTACVYAKCLCPRVTLFFSFYLPGDMYSWFHYLLMYNPWHLGTWSTAQFNTATFQPETCVRLIRLAEQLITHSVCSGSSTYHKLSEPLPLLGILGARLHPHPQLPQLTATSTVAQHHQNLMQPILSVDQLLSIAMATHQQILQSFVLPATQTQTTPSQPSYDLAAQSPATMYPDQEQPHSAHPPATIHADGHLQNELLPSIQDLHPYSSPEPRIIQASLPSLPHANVQQPASLDKQVTAEAERVVSTASAASVATTLPPQQPASSTGGETQRVLSLGQISSIDGSSSVGGTEPAAGGGVAWQGSDSNEDAFEQWMRQVSSGYKCCRIVS